MGAFTLLLFAQAAVSQVAVPPPPRPSSGAPQKPAAPRKSEEGAMSLKATAQFLQDKLISIGRVGYSLYTHNTKTGASSGPAQAWEEVSSLTIDSRTCEMKVKWNSSEGNSGGTYFFEELGSPEAVPSKDHLNRLTPDVEHSIFPTVYSVSFPTNGMDFKVPDEQTASRIASAFARLIAACKIIPHTTAGGPSLEETLGFIEDKLNTQGTVNWLATFQDTVAGTSHAPVQVSSDISSVAGDRGTCRLNFHQKNLVSGKTTVDAAFFVNFRRVDKLEVMGLQESVAKQYARQGHPEWVETISPTVYELDVIGAENRTWYFPFADEDMANRVAKAMLHAVELCGGSHNAPF
jgi:hypothetical protein